ncbi:hypothetical protein ACNOYE_39965 [Nannocystaceae bacterium ST9]
MSTRLRELATSAGCCALVIEAAGCRPSTTIVTPEEGTTTGEAERCPAPPETPKPAPGSSDDREPPRIVSAHFNGSDRVTLSFSEGLEPPKQVNPRQFRLSEGYSLVNYAAGYPGGAYASAYYYDLAARYGDGQPLIFTSIEQPEPDQLVLVLNRAIPPPICENIRVAQQDAAAAAAIPDAPPTKTRHALFLHYTKRGSVGIRDLASNQLDDFGGEWALDFGTRDKRLSGQAPLVRFDLLIELDCPAPGEFIGPPGPS